MGGKNWGKVINDNMVFLTIIPLIFGIHWGWWRIQKNPDLVDSQDHRRALPIYSMYKDVYNKFFGGQLIEDVTNTENKQSVKK